MKSNSLPSTVMGDIIGDFSDRSLRTLMNNVPDDTPVGKVREMNEALASDLWTALHGRVDPT